MKTFLAARASCLADGADLVSVHSAAEDSVAEAAGLEAGYNSFWIGMSDIDVSYLWKRSIAIAAVTCLGPVCNHFVATDIPFKTSDYDSF